MISIVIPALNEEKLLLRCLESLKKQDYKGKHEVIVVDNGSVDKTRKIARNFGVKVVDCPQKGVVYARQLGAEVASGDIIVQGDADTIYPTDWLSRIHSHFLRKNFVGVAGNWIYDNPPWWAGVEYFLRNFINMVTSFIFGKPFWVAGANFAYYKKHFRGYNKNDVSPDQYGISVRIAKHGKILYDRNLKAKTSSRTVQKPVLVVTVESIFNLVKTMRIPPIGLSFFILGVLIFFSYGYFIPTSQVFGKVYYKEHTTDKIIALTFDDGPNEPYTSQILDVLDSYNVKGTFFLIGKNAEKYPDVVKRMVSEGHVIGDHTYSNDPQHAIKPDGCKDIKKGQDALENITGLKVDLYRPPYGKKTPWELQCVKKLNMKEIEWSVSTNDQHKFVKFGKPGVNGTADSIIRKARPGKIILLHDGFGTCYNCTGSDKSETVDILPIVIKNLQEKGYRFVTIPELFNITEYKSVLT